MRSCTSDGSDYRLYVGKEGHCNANSRNSLRYGNLSLVFATTF